MSTTMANAWTACWRPSCRHHVDDHDGPLCAGCCNCRCDGPGRLQLAAHRAVNAVFYFVVLSVASWAAAEKPLSARRTRWL